MKWDEYSSRCLIYNLYQYAIKNDSLPEMYTDKTILDCWEKTSFLTYFIIIDDLKKFIWISVCEVGAPPVCISIS